DDKSHGLGDMLFDMRIDLRESADRAGDRTSRNLLARRLESLPGAVELGISDGELESEGGGLGVDAVGAADRGRGLVLVGPPLECRQQLVDVRDQNIGGTDKLHIEAGVENV